MAHRKIVSVGVTEFKRRCLGLIADVESGRVERLVLTRRGRGVAEIGRLRVKSGHFDLWGSMRGTVTIPAGTDLTGPTGEVWDAERDDGPTYS